MPNRTRPFAHYDKRGYETHDVVSGYARWAPIYNERMDRRFDLDLMERSALLTQRLAGASVVDLACGTGRIGRWLRTHEVARIVGIDLSPDMLEHADGYDELVEADILATELPSASFDGATTSMALCHVADLEAFFAEAARLLRPGGFLFAVDYHPYFLMNGIPTHFDDPQTGVSHAVIDHVHAMSDYFRDAQRWFDVVELDERFIDDAWVAATPGYAKFLGWPVTLSYGYSRR